MFNRLWIRVLRGVMPTTRLVVSDCGGDVRSGLPLATSAARHLCPALLRYFAEPKEQSGGVMPHSSVRFTNVFRSAHPCLRSLAGGLFGLEDYLATIGSGDACESAPALPQRQAFLSRRRKM